MLVARYPQSVTDQSAPVIIVGAGLAGLRSAQVLADNGVSAVVLERSAHVGGRLHSFTIDGYTIDQGFQLVNPSYPELIATGILNDVDLRPFASAIEFHANGRCRILADPRRQPLLALHSVKVASPSQLLRVGLLLSRLAYLPARRITAGLDMSTRDGLQRAGLDDKTIDTVMQPFLRGTLLDDELSSSWIFCQLLLKSFARGRPSTLPEGIEALAQALAARSGAQVRLNSFVTKVSPTSVEVNGTSIAAAAVIVATDADEAAGLISVNPVAWNRQLCWWWSTPKIPGDPRLRIDLDDRMTTSALDFTTVAPERAPFGRSLIGTPTISGTESDVQRARESVARLYDLENRDIELITATEVTHALPRVSPPFHTVRKNYSEGVVLAGDYLTSSSIQGALVSGRRAAESTLAKFRQRTSTTR
jgi:phytoene dehydrogenase-like protein